MNNIHTFWGVDRGRIPFDSGTMLNIGLGLELGYRGDELSVPVRVSQSKYMVSLGLCFFSIWAFVVNINIDRDVRPRGLASASSPLEEKILWPRPRRSWPRPRGSGFVEPEAAEETIIIIMILSYWIVVFSSDCADCINLRYFIIGWHLSFELFHVEN